MEAKEIIFSCLFFAIFIEGTVEYIKLTIEKKIYWEVIVAFVIGITLCFGYKLDFVKALLGIEPVIPYLGNAVSAVVVARGSNYMFDLVGKFTGAKEEMEGILFDDDYQTQSDIVNHEDEDGVG